MVGEFELQRAIPLQSSYSVLVWKGSALARPSFVLEGVSEMMQSDSSETHLSKECRLAIGDFCCSLACTDATLAANFREYYAGFLLNGREPDLVIELDVVYHPLGAYQAPDSLLVTKVAQGNRFSFGSGLLEGSLHLSEKRCKIVVKEALLGGMCVRIFEQFLYQVYYTLLHNQNPRPTSFLIHASGVSRDGKGFLFAGRSGSGKSTIASLASKETVLNDETIIVEKRNGDFWVRSTPFNGNFKSKKNSSAPLKAIFLLEHAKENRLKPLSKADFVRKFVREVVISAPLLSMDRESAFSEMLNFCSQLVEEVPTYQLGFRPDRSFWQCIDEEENLL